MKSSAFFFTAALFLHALAGLLALVLVFGGMARVSAQNSSVWIDPDTQRPVPIAPLPEAGGDLPPYPEGTEFNALPPPAGADPFGRLFELQNPPAAGGENPPFQEPTEDNFQPLFEDSTPLRRGGETDPGEAPQTDPTFAPSTEETLAPEEPPAPNVPVPVLKIGVLATGNHQQLVERYDVFRLYIEQRIAPRRAELMLLPGYRELVRALTAGDVHFAQLTTAAFADAHARCRCVSPLASPIMPSGNDGFVVIAVTRPFENLESLAGAKGIRIGLSSKYSLAGYLLPNGFLRQQGIDIVAAGGSNEMMPAASPAEAFMLVKGNRADIAFGWGAANGDPNIGTFAELARTGQAAASDFKLLWRSSRVPFSPFVVHATVPVDAQQTLRQTLLDLYRLAPELYTLVEPYYGGGYKPVEAGDYALVTNLYQLSTAPQSVAPPPAPVEENAKR